MIILFILFITIPVLANAPTEIELSNGSIVEVTFTEKQNGYSYEVNFENGHKYSYEQSGNGGVILGTKLTGKEMSLAEEAIDKYEQEYGSAHSGNKRSSNNLIGIALILIGSFPAVFPYAAWYLEIGWKLHDAKPSYFALFVNRASGIIISIIGIIILIWPVMYP